MFPSEYNDIIREHFDISDSATRKCIVALEDSEQSQLLSALTNALYDKIVEKVDKIDFGSIPNSRGDITKVDGFDNTVECLNIMRKLVLEYKQNPEAVDTVLAAIENIKSRKALFIKAYSLNAEFPMVLYNLIVLAIEQTVSFLISICIQYIKDPATQDIAAALDKVAYNNTKDNLLYEQLSNFNKACLNGDIDTVINDIFKNGGKVNEEFSAASGIEDTGAGVNTIVINVGKDIASSNKPCPSPFQRFDDECDNETPNDSGETQVVNGCSDTVPQTVNEFVPLPLPIIIGAATAGSVLVLKGIRIALRVVIPLMRNVSYYLYSIKFSFKDTLAVQAQFIEANAYKLQYSTNSGMDDNKKAKVVQKQLKWADRLKSFSNKIAIENKKAEKEAKKLVNDEAKKMKIDDIQDQLPVDIASKNILF